MTKPYKVCFIILLVIDQILILWLAGFILFENYINGFVTDKQRKTDAIVVLTGGRNRIAEAISLFNAGLAKKMLISGVSDNVTIQDIEAKTKVYINNPEKVELGYEAHDTIGNAREIKTWIEKNNISSVRLVTSNYHLPRSMVELNALNLPIEVLPHPVYSDHISEKWYKSWGTFKFIAAEYNKFMAAYLRNSF